LKAEQFLGNTDIGYNFISHGSEFTESVLGVAFLIALVKQFMLCDVLADFPKTGPTGPAPTPMAMIFRYVRT